jgi:hypothetical protein
MGLGRLLLLIRGIAPVLYILAAGGALLGLRSFLRARYDLRLSQFSLEREQAEERGGWAITQILLLIEVGILFFVLANVTYTAWDQHENPNAVVVTPSQTVAFSTGVPLDTGQSFTVPTPVQEGIEIRPTQPPSPTFAGTVQPADDPVGCLADQVNITLPSNGQVIFENQPVMGTANIQNFGYYRFEIRNIEEGGEFGVMEADYTSPVTNGPLGQLIPQNFVPGEYRFRLAVFDTTGSTRGACEISVFFSDPLPTQTPIGAGVSIPTSAAFATATP